MNPRKPGHADKASTPPGVELRVQVRRRLVDYSYAVGSPAYATPEYDWDLLVDGRCISTFRRRRDAVAEARSSSAAQLLAGSQR